MNESTLHIAVIGKGNQASRHIEILNKMPSVKLHSVFYPKPVQDTGLPLTFRLSDILAADAIIISSPTPTHAFYLQELSDYKGYLLVEKPAVSTATQSDVLQKWPLTRKRKVRINFNLVHSSLFQSFARVLQNSEMGQLISLDIHTSHGLAFKPAYLDSWRNKSDASGGVLETVGIHYVNMAIKLFGPPVSMAADFLWAAQAPAKKKNGTPDTAILRLKFKNGLLATFRHSYAAPFRHHWFLLGTNGTWEYDGRTVRFRTPRDTFDSNGRFVEPPLVLEEPMEFTALWKDSLNRAVQDFVNVVRSKKSFDPKEFDRGLYSMELIREALRHSGDGAQ